MWVQFNKLSWAKMKMIRKYDNFFVYENKYELNQEYGSKQNRTWWMNTNFGLELEHSALYIL